MNLQHLGCWNHLEKLAEMFQNTFHRELILLKLKIKKLLRKTKSKNLTARVLIGYRTVMRGSRNFRQGGGGGPGQSEKKALTTFFLVLSLFYSRKWLISKKTIFSRFLRGSNIFQGGGGGSNFFRGGGFQLLIPIENI